MGERHVSARAVAQRVDRELRGGEEQLPVTTTRPPHGPGRAGSRRVGVHVEGLDDVMVRLSRCCTPVPGDEIMGFVTRGRGVSVHRADCANATALANQTQRVIDVEWDRDYRAALVRWVEVEALDRSRLLSDVAQDPDQHHINILERPHRADLERPGRAPALRLRAGRPKPPRLDPAHRATGGGFDLQAHRLLPGRRSTN